MLGSSLIIPIALRAGKPLLRSAAARRTLHGKWYALVAFSPGGDGTSAAHAPLPASISTGRPGSGAARAGAAEPARRLLVLPQAGTAAVPPPGKRPVVAGRGRAIHRRSQPELYAQEDNMNRDILEGKWKQVRGQMKQWWGQLTDDDLDRVGGKRDKLVGLLQEKYGYAKEKAEEEIDRRLNQFAEHDEEFQQR
jgi:uncharacterized protein YjbJ (UPF0337 family)